MPAKRCHVTHNVHRRGENVSLWPKMQNAQPGRSSIRLCLFPPSPKITSLAPTVNACLPRGEATSLACPRKFSFLSSCLLSSPMLERGGIGGRDLEMPSLPSFLQESRRMESLPSREENVQSPACHCLPLVAGPPAAPGM